MLLDDVIVFSQNIEDHFKQLKEVLVSLKSVGVTFLLQNEISSLTELIISAISSFQVHLNYSNLQLNFWRTYVRNNPWIAPKLPWNLQRLQTLRQKLLQHSSIDICAAQGKSLIQETSRIQRATAESLPLIDNSGWRNACFSSSEVIPALLNIHGHIQTSSRVFPVPNAPRHRSQANCLLAQKFK